MKFSLSWLQDHLETDATLDELTKRMTDIGLEVENVTDPSKTLTSFIIVSIVDIKSHPNAEKLKICQVDTGAETVKVICGAPNVEKGMKSVYAAPGCVIPTTGKKLKATKIRGVESDGMLCSEHELGLGNNHDGIIRIPEEAPLGKEYASYIGLDDPIFDISITPNRADCLGISGIARDLSAAGLGKLNQRKFKPIEGMFKSPITVKRELSVEKENSCPLFLGQYIRGVRNNSSPKWMQDRLLSAGLRPISALVDITNFITMDQNRPAHVFDADKIKGDKLWIRLSKNGATFSALNGQDYVLDDTMTVIGDKSGILSLAGIIGGESSSCTEETTNVFVEVALFDPVVTASTGRKLNIETDARYRFERGIDPDFAHSGIELTSKLITEICGGEASDIVIAGNIPDNWKREIIFRPSRVESLGGLKVEPELCCSILEKLGFNSKKHTNDTLLISPPSWRGDIVGEADLVEEILRMIGFDSIKPLSLPPIANVSKSILPLPSRRVSWMRRALTSRGMSEVITWSFMSGSEAAYFGSINENLKLENPISSDLDMMRPSILPNLVHASRKNSARGYPNLALFEGGPQYSDNTYDGQKQVVAGIRAGKAIIRSHFGNDRDVDSFDVKADALAALEAAQSPMNGLVCGTEAPDWYHPGRSGSISLGKNNLGFFGQLHPAALKALAIDFPIMAFEIFVDKIPQHKKRRGHSRPAFIVSDLPVVGRDFAFVIDESVTSRELIDAAFSADKELITNVDVFDIYQGKTLGDNKKSIAISIKLQPHKKTLTDSEIDIISQKVIYNVEKITGGSLRE